MSNTFRRNLFQFTTDSEEDISAGQNFTEGDRGRARVLKVLDSQYPNPITTGLAYISEESRAPNRKSGHSGLHLVEVRRVPVTVPDGEPVNGWQLLKPHPTDTELEHDVLEHSPDCDRLKYTQSCIFDCFMCEGGWDDLDEEGVFFVWVEWEYSGYPEEYNGFISWTEADPEQPMGSAT